MFEMPSGRARRRGAAGIRGAEIVRDAHRRELRSRPLGAECEHVAEIDQCEVARCRAVSSRNHSVSQTDSEFSVQPATRHVAIACIVPLQWKNGAALMKRVDGVRRWQRAT